MIELQTGVLIGIGAICVGVGYLGGIQHMQYHIARLIKRAMLIAEEEEDNPNAINVYIEQKEEDFFVYNADTDEYMAHAKNTELLIEKLKARFPGKSYMCTGEDFAKVVKKNTDEPV